MSPSEEELINNIRKYLGEDVTERRGTYYTFGGWRQDPTRVKFIEKASQIAAERGLPLFNPSVAIVEQGQRRIPVWKVSGTDIYADVEGANWVNNYAMQQMADDLRRTVIVGLDTPHTFLQRRLGKEVSPETINYFLEVLNHTIAGGPCIQEIVAYVNPELSKDAYAKVFTGDDELADRIDDRFLIDINKEFPKNQAEQLKKAIGKRLYMVARTPTIVGRNLHGGAVYRWVNMQSMLAFIAAYRLAANEAIIADLAYAVKHADIVLTGTPTFMRRVSPHNEGLGRPIGFALDASQASRVYPDDLVGVTEEGRVCTYVVVQIYGQSAFLAGAATSGMSFQESTNFDIMETFYAHMLDYVQRKYGELAKAKPSWDLIKDISTEAVTYFAELMDKYPSMLEIEWSSGQRFMKVGAAAAAGVGYATGNSIAAYDAVNYASMLFKEVHGRTGWVVIETTPYLANPHLTLPDFALMPELQGMNIPWVSYCANGLVAYSAGVAAAHAARGDAFCVNPLIKVAFADKNLKVDWAHIRQTIAKGAIGDFVPDGERPPWR